jgi:DNA-binding CsgD family transcriptional regulator
MRPCRSCSPCILHRPADDGVLTAAEKAVGDLLCEGQTLAQVARLRGVSLNTVKSQVRQIFRKLNVDSRVALVRLLSPERSAHSRQHHEEHVDHERAARAGSLLRPRQ